VKWNLEEVAETGHRTYWYV